MSDQDGHSSLLQKGKAAATTTAYYGAATQLTPQCSRDSLERVPEEDDNHDDDDEEMSPSPARYKRSARLYTLVPLSSALVFLLLAPLPFLLWPSPHPTHPLALLSPALLAAALWSLAHVLRIPLYGLAARAAPATALATPLSAVLRVLVQEALRLAALAILHPHHHLLLPQRTPSPADPLFLDAWFLALGWALAEVATSIAQGFEQLALYSDVDTRAASKEQLVRRWDGNRSGQSTQDAQDEAEAEGAEEEEEESTDVGQELDEELSRLMNMKARAELEEVYGMPFIDIPVFVSVLQRIDSILLSLGLTLLLSFAYARAAAPTPRHSSSSSSSSLPLLLSSSSSSPSLWPIFAAVTTLHALLALLHAPPALLRIGVHTAAYVGLLAGLGCVFAGMGVWGALS